MAAVTAMLDRRPQTAGIQPEGSAQLTTEVLRDAGVLPRYLERWLFSRLAARLFAAQERLLYPGLGTGLVLRKRYVDDQVRVALDSGAQQLVVLGAGFDPLALRHRRARPGLCTIELDHPATQTLKARAYAALDGDDRPSLITLDLVRGSLEDSLREASCFRVGVRSVFVAEGLLMYLPEEDVVRLMATFSLLTGPGSRLVFSYLRTDARGRPSLGRFPGLMRGLARVGGEPFGWAVSHAHLTQFLERRGLRPLHVPTERELAEVYLAGRDLGVGGAGELFAVAERP